MVLRLRLIKDASAKDAIRRVARLLRADGMAVLMRAVTRGMNDLEGAGAA